MFSSLSSTMRTFLAIEDPTAGGSAEVGPPTLPELIGPDILKLRYPRWNNVGRATSHRRPQPCFAGPVHRASPGAGRRGRSPGPLHAGVRRLPDRAWPGDADQIG